MGRRTVVALDQVDLTVGRGEAIGIVGESGCGKTTLARVLVGLQHLDSGELSGELSGEHVPRRTGPSHLQLVWQDPSAALDPRQPIGAALDESLLLAGDPDPDSRARGTDRLLERVGLDPALGSRRPSGLSGGQRQRVVIARALAARPRVLVLDEPVSSLDVTVRAEILDLLAGMHTNGMALVLISHDLAVVRRLVHRVLVMAEGRIVESGPVTEVLHHPRHPATRDLVDALPRLAPHNPTRPARKDDD